MAKNKQSNLYSSLQMLNIVFINKNIMNSQTEGGSIQYWLITNHLSQMSFHEPPSNYFSL